MCASLYSHRQSSQKACVPKATTLSSSSKAANPTFFIFCQKNDTSFDLQAHLNHSLPLTLPPRAHEQVAPPSPPALPSPRPEVLRRSTGTASHQSVAIMLSDDPTSYPGRWLGAAAGLVIPSVVGWAQWRLLGLADPKVAAAASRRTGLRSHRDAAAAVTGATTTAAPTQGMTTRSKSRQQPQQEEEEAGEETALHFLSGPPSRHKEELAAHVEGRQGGRVLDVCCKAASTLLCLLLLLAPLPAPLGLLGRVMLALGGFGVCAKTLEARAGFMVGTHAVCLVFSLVYQDIKDLFKTQTPDPRTSNAVLKFRC